MDQHYHGYYIHGQSPWNKSDLPMGWLKYELDNNTKSRGINPTIDNQNGKGNVPKNLQDDI